MAQNYFTLDKAIREILLKSGEGSEAKYPVYNLYAISFMDEFRFDAAREVRTVRLDMAPDRTVSLPHDYIDWAKVGIENSGYVIPFSYNPNLSKLPNDASVEAQLINYIDSWGTHCGYLPCNGYFKPYANDFTIDPIRKVMRFSSNTDVTAIYMEYLSSAIDICADTPFNPYATAALTAFIKWKESEFKKDSFVNYWRTEYYNEFRRLQGRLNPFSIQMMVEILNSSQNINVR